MRVSELAALALATGVAAYDLPDNLKEIYEKHKVCMHPGCMTRPGRRGSG